MFSIICVYNNKDILERHLLKSLKKQTTEFELVTIDNTNQQFKSIAKAFNQSGSKINNKYIMFVHQDVELLSNKWLEEAEKHLNLIKDLGIAGVAGMSETGKTNRERGRNIIEYGPDHRLWEWGNKINAPELVQTLDECLVIIPKTVFQNLKFDEEVCEGWHLYAVDYCLNVKKMNLGTYVIPMYIYRRSSCLLSSQYYQTIEKIITKHKDHVKWIYTTCGEWNTFTDVVKQFSYELEEKNKTIELLTDSIKRKEKEINYIYNSLFWKVWNSYGRLINTILPQGSKRRKLYTFFIKKIKRNSFIEDSDKWAKTETANVSSLPNIYRMNNRVYKNVTISSFLNSQYDYPSIDIIIVTYNSSKFVENLYKTIMASNYELKKLNITFIDNNSKDNTLELLNGLRVRHKISNFNIIENPKNIGYGGAINHAVLSCKSNYILVLNPDIELHPDCIKILLETALLDKTAYIWEPRQLPYEHPKFYCPITLETIWSSGAAFLIRRDKFEEINGFDKSFYLYVEDVDLSFKIRNKGGKLRYVPSAIVYHYTYSEPEQTKPIQQYYSIRNHMFIRYRFGTYRQILEGYILFIKLFINGDKWMKHGRKTVLKIFVSHLKYIPYMFYWRVKNFNAKRFEKYKFFDWDYEMRKEGAFYKHELPTSYPLVSVIIRTKQRPHLLNDALISILNQTYKNLEVIVIEDGKATAENVINGFQNLRITYKSTGTTIGRCKAGNLGLSLSTGEYLCFLDDDDIFYPDHIEVLVSALLRHPEYKLAYSSSFEAKIVNQNNQFIIKELESHFYSFDRKELMIRNLFPIQAALFHRSLYTKMGGLDEDLDVLEDWDLWRRYVSQTDFLFIPKTTSEFRTPFDPEERIKRQKILDENYIKVVNKLSQEFPLLE